MPFDLFDPFGLSAKATPEKKERGLLAEINNGALVFFVAAFLRALDRDPGPGSALVRPRGPSPASSPFLQPRPRTRPRTRPRSTTVSFLFAGFLLVYASPDPKPWVGLKPYSGALYSTASVLARPWPQPHPSPGPDSDSDPDQQRQPPTG